MVLPVTIYTKYEDGYQIFQKVTSPDSRIEYVVRDLRDCPEDATIFRDLFSAYQYLDAIKLGMRLAEEGYTHIELHEKKEEREYDD